MQYKKIFAYFVTIVSFISFFMIDANALDVQKSSSARERTNIYNRDQLMTHVGLVFGVGSPEGDYETAPEYGVDVGLQPITPLSLGAELTFSKNDNDAKTDDLQRTTLLFKGAYNFGGDIPVIKDSYIGLGVGPVFKEDETGIASAPIIGFDIPLKNVDHYFLSLGASARYLVVSGSDPDTFSANAVIKYWY